MITLLSHIFIKDQDISDPKTRTAYGSLCCVTGIFFNILLFALKYFAGSLSGSIAITADAFNNLSDAGSSVITLAGIKLAGKKPDPEHPFGHGRLEYLSGLAVSVIIIIVGVELFRSSAEKILHPVSIDTSPYAMTVLAVSILVKGYMFFYNRKIGRKINSAGMKATAVDSLGDAAATLLVLISTVVACFTDVQIDGWCGVLVSLFIVYTGINSAKDTVRPLLGSVPDREFVEKIEKIVMSYEKITGIHDLLVHDYGPGRVIVSLHAEVSGDDSIYELHNVIDTAEHKLASELGCIAVIHMDPVEKEIDSFAKIRGYVRNAVKEIDENITIHDFRLMEESDGTKLIFDAVVPFSVDGNDEQIRQEIIEKISEKCRNFCIEVNIDRPFM